MAAEKFLRIDDTTGLAIERSAIDASTGSADAGRLVATDINGLISPTFLPTDGSATLTATETLAAGDLISLWDNGGIKMRKATNTGHATRAQGFVNSGVASGATGVAILGDGINTGVSGLAVAGRYFLGTSGAVTTTPPTASGSIVQFVGTARASTELNVVLGDPLIRE